MKEDPTSKVIFFVMSVRKIQSKFDKKKGLLVDNQICIYALIPAAKKMTFKLVSSLVVNLVISTRIRSLNGQNPSS